MSDKDQDKTQQDSLEPDDLDSLSEEEKAAFEKIMAEISVATTGESTPENRPEPDKPAHEEAETKKNPPSNEKQDEIIVVDDQNSPRAGSSKSEIGDADDTDHDEVIQENGDDASDLDDDQQDALNKIMAEIEAKRKGETAGTSQDTNPQDDGDNDALSQDQQDALNQIMSEIEAKRNVDQTETTPASEDSEDQETLSDDQQDALDKIMAEIEAKKGSPGSSSPDDASEPGETTDRDGDATAEESTSQSNTSDLTIDQFNNELSSLLASSQISDAAEVTGNGQESVPTSGSTMENPVPKPVSDANAKGDRTDVGTSNDKAARAVQSAEREPTPVPVLHEVTPDPKESSGEKKGSQKNQRSKVTSARVGRWFIRGAMMVIVPVGLLTMVMGGYLSYQQFKHWRQTGIFQLFPDNTAAPPPVQPPGQQQQAAATSLRAAPSSPAEPVNSADEISMDASETVDTGKAALETAITQIQTKMSDIQSLKAYYRAGIEADIDKIESLVHLKKPTLSYGDAITVKGVDLTVRSIQRRITYIDKLEKPLKEMTALSEKLLFLERQVHLFDTLSTGISGLPTTGLQKEIDLSLNDSRDYLTNLSIDDVQAPNPDVEKVWEMIVSQINEKATRLSKDSTLNLAIGKEICSGDFGPKYQLTSLSEATAECLINWNGKDLFLNELTDLSPGSAKILARWQGEWLSLNGLKTISPETAHYLSQWSGKRLSLNGMTILSPEATKNLSQWHGDQLEMVGLQSIGSWENYSTRLYLSDTLQRRLETQ